jgi:hypothetical protein
MCQEEQFNNFWLTMSIPEEIGAISGGAFSGVSVARLDVISNIVFMMDQTI